MKINSAKMVTYMNETDMTLTKLAKLSGVSRATLSAVRNGKSCLYETATLIAEALGVDVSELIAKGR